MRIIQYVLYLYCDNIITYVLSHGRINTHICVHRYIQIKIMKKNDVLIT